MPAETLLADVGADGELLNAVAFTTMLIGVGDAVIEVIARLGDVVAAVSVPLVIAIRTCTFCVGGAF